MNEPRQQFDLIPLLARAEAAGKPERTAAEEREASVALLRRTADYWEGLAAHRKVRADKYQGQGDHRAAESERRDAQDGLNTAKTLRDVARLIERGES